MGFLTKKRKVEEKPQSESEESSTLEKAATWARDPLNTGTGKVSGFASKHQDVADKKKQKVNAWAKRSVQSHTDKIISKVSQWASKLEGRTPTEEERNTLIKSVSEQVTREIVESSPEKIEDPTGEVREIILADVMREVKQMVDTEIASGREPKPKTPKKTV